MGSLTAYFSCFKFRVKVPLVGLESSECSISRGTKQVTINWTLLVKYFVMRYSLDNTQFVSRF